MNARRLLIVAGLCSCSNSPAQAPRTAPPPPAPSASASSRAPAASIPAVSTRSVPLAADAIQAQSAALEATFEAQGLVEPTSWQLVDARRVSFAGESRVIIALHADAQHCVIGGVDPRNNRATVIQSRTQVCKALRFLSDDDLNQDGVPDLLYEILLPSNRYPADIEEPLVYLSVVAERSYCYSDRLKHWAGGPATYEQGIAEQARDLASKIGPEAFECATPPPP